MTTNQIKFSISFSTKKNTMRCYIEEKTIAISTRHSFVKYFLECLKYNLHSMGLFLQQGSSNNANEITFLSLVINSIKTKIY